MAASGPCTSVTFTIQPDQVTAPDPQVVVLTEVDSFGDTYTVTISSTLSATTTTGQSSAASGGVYQGFNLSTAGSGWNGDVADDGSGDYTYNGFGPGAGVGAIVLNQRSSVDPEPDGVSPLGSDVQTLEFVTRKNGVVIDPENFTIDIFDITSVFGEPGSPPNSGWRALYWDAVGFSVEPASITPSGTFSYGPGVGSGTLASPFRRAGEIEPTVADGYIEDKFFFDTFPSGSTMQYTNHAGARGWHFISISGISFEMGNCVRGD